MKSKILILAGPAPVSKVKVHFRTIKSSENEITLCQERKWTITMVPSEV